MANGKIDMGLRVYDYTTESVTVGGNSRSNVDISTPSFLQGKTIKTILFRSATGSILGAWIIGNVIEWNSSNIRLALYNTHQNSQTFTCELAVFYE